MKRDRIREAFLEQLRKVPIIQFACEKVGVARSSAYRWMDEDGEFKKQVALALAEGETFMNEMTEAQVVALIKERHWPAMRFWLTHHDTKYSNRLEIIPRSTEEDSLDEQQKEIAERALKAIKGLKDDEEDVESEDDNEGDEEDG